MNRRELEELSDRVEGILDAFAGAGDPVALERAEDLVRSLLTLHGTALARMVELVDDPDTMRRLADDDLVGGILVLHDLHPDDVETRIQRALDAVRPYLGSHAGGIDLLGVDDQGVAHLRLEGTCDGCPSSQVTVSTAVETAVRGAAPEVVTVETEGVVAETRPTPLLQIGLRPGLEHASGPTDPAAEPTWVALAAALTDGELSARSVGGVPLVLCSVAGTAYAYADRCPGCASAMSGGHLAGSTLTCPGCGHAYDIRLAGRSLDGAAQHLDPVPLLPDGAGWTVAVPARVPA